MAVNQWQTWTVCWSKHKEWRLYITTKHLLKENRMIKSSHPLFEGGTAKVAFDRLCVPLTSLGGTRRWFHATSASSWLAGPKKETY